MNSVLNEVSRLFLSAIKEAFPGIDLPNGIVQASPGGRFGDYTCLAPMTISQVKCS